MATGRIPSESAGSLHGPGSSKQVRGTAPRGRGCCCLEVDRTMPAVPGLACTGTGLRRDKQHDHPCGTTRIPEPRTVQVSLLRPLSQGHRWMVRPRLNHGRLRTVKALRGWFRLSSAAAVRPEHMPGWAWAHPASRPLGEGVRGSKHVGPLKQAQPAGVDHHLVAGP